MEKEIELLLQVFKSSDATLNETKEALLNLLKVSRSLPTETELTSEIERQIFEYKKENPYIIEDEKETVLELGYRKCWGWISKR